MIRKRGCSRELCMHQTEYTMEKEDPTVKKLLGVVAVLLLVAAVPMWAGNDRDVVNPADPGSYTPPDPNSPTWAGPEAVLYENGPLVTHPGGGFSGADASAVQTTLGLTIYGFGHALSTGFRIADDFTVTDSGGWDVQTITFFAYQTNSGSGSTINHVNLRIWNGDPSGSGTVIFGDTTTNRMASTGWSNIYRVLDTGLTDTARPIMANVANVGTTLAAGTYWLDWQTGGTLSSGPWAPPISILSQTATGNALQFDPATTTWNPALDVDSQQGFPFIIEGVVVPVELQSFDVE
jgi:hypothetical protein